MRGPGIAQAPVPYYWTLDEYHRAIDAGVFAERRVELLQLLGRSSKCRR